jgi:exodeoxyribonuclease VII large subunit
MTPRRASRGAEDSDLDLFAPTSPPPPPKPPSASRAPKAKRSSEEPKPADTYPGETAQSAVTVSMLTQAARDVIEGAFIPLWVRGEVSDFKAHRNGHWYFCLRDRMSQIKCVVWSRDQRGVPASPDDGMQVVAFGRLSVYAARSEMQFTVLRIEAEGDGLRRKALERTRARLAADGLLAPERKRPLPRFPRVIAVITSLDGAALHDIVAVMRRRAASVRLIIVPAKVQGDGAVLELCAALDRVNRWGKADLVIIGRGGGGREDLWAFNDERVARAVAACDVPTISAVGHEVDISICDLVADVRAPTPSAAAEAATRSRAELQGELRKVSLRMSAAARALVKHRSEELRNLERDVGTASAELVHRRRAALQDVAGRLNALSPVATLARGYAVARSEDGVTLSEVAAFRDGMPFELVVRDGVVSAEVRGRRANKPESP